MGFEGILTALITPFDGDQLDLDALRRLVTRQIDEGVHGLVACGTTGETPTLTDAEFDQVVATTVEVAAGRVPVLAGTGGNDTRRTIARTRRARELGADAALVVTPYYNKPQQEGLFLHFQAVARDGGLPVMLYNVPGRTGVSLAPTTTARLATLAGIVAVKEASGSIAAVRDIVAATPADFGVLSGDDGMALASWAVGARGVVTVAGNVACRPMVAMWKAWRAGRVQEAAAIDRRLAPLYAALFVETSPAPVKAAAAMLGICGHDVRLPLVAASASTREAVRAALAAADLL